VIAIASTYLIDGLQNKHADALLLSPNAARSTIGSNKVSTAQQILDGIRNGQEALVGKVTNLQWTVEGDQAWVIWDGIFPGQQLPGCFRG
jgi:hypothetical protein